MKEAAANTIYLKDYLPPAFTIESVELYFNLMEQGTHVRSRLAIKRHTTLPPEKRLWLDGELLKLVSLSVDEKELSADQYQIESNGIWIDVPEVDRFVVESEVKIDPENNTALEGLYRSDALFCTQCEAEGFRRITWYMDRPDVMATFTTTIEADRTLFPVLLSNGNPVRAEEVDAQRHKVTWHDPFPKPCYLFALVAGDLALLQDSFTTMSGRTVALRIYSEAENIDQCDFAMQSLKEAMLWDEQTYGREYDLDIFMLVAVNDFNMGAMENKGLNIFNAKLVLAAPDTATDADYHAIQSVVGHEYFHNWSGNRVTCRDWFQLSLKEGFTVFRDQEFSSDMTSRDVQRIQDVRMLRAHQFAEDASPMAHPVRPDSYMEINNFYTLTVYEKGAEVVRMQANLLGPDVFRKATDLYFKRHDGQAVTTDDFVKCMEDASGRDLSQFKRWYSQSGTPKLHFEAQYNAAQHELMLKVSQECPVTPGQEEKKPFHIPVAVGLLDKDGHDLPVILKNETLDAMDTPGTRVLELHNDTMEFVFTNLPHEPELSLLRNFSAPVNFEYDYRNSDLIFLMAHDSDGFSRWDAAQLLHQRVLLSRVENPECALPEGYIAAFRKALLDDESDKQLLSEILMLPSESYLGDQMEQVDVDAIQQSRTGLMTEIATELKKELLSVYLRNGDLSAFSNSHAAVSRRALRNLILNYLSYLDDTDIEQLAIDQYERQHNMTDVMAALTVLVHSGSAASIRLLEDFESNWNDNPLVMDKWFSVQATSRQPNTLENIRALMTHPGFTLKNPNRVRALIGAFVGANPVQFHRRDGAGYQLLAEVVLQLNSKNPQIAARLIRQMSRWRRYDGLRQELMRKQLERILETDELSKDVLEIVSKSLNT